MLGKSLKILLGILVLALAGMNIVKANGFYSNRDLIDKSKACLDCHDGMPATLSGSSHQLSRDTDLKSPMVVGCIGCHDGWEKHMDDPSKETIANLVGYSLFDLAGVCNRCHQTAHQAAMISTNPHNRTDITCLSCHTIHQSPGKMLESTPERCLSCHKNVAAEFKARSAHPLESGNVSCTDCHNIDDMKDNRLAVGLDWTCQKCHTDQAGPFIHEHPVVYTHLVNGEGCTECHNPHGSPNDRLLKQPGNGVCLQCHAIPPLHRVQHSGLGTKLACVDCHTEIHGSYDNEMLLDPDLGTKLFPDCYQSGCHSINR